jgi:hypothetical protein
MGMFSYIGFPNFWIQEGENSIYHRVKWYRVVLDEAHHIKTHKSQVAHAAIALSSHCRWCLTGTPLQVNYQETLCVIYKIARIVPPLNLNVSLISLSTNQFSTIMSFLFTSLKLWWSLLQNSLEDLYSLLSFLRVEPWCNWQWYVKCYANLQLVQIWSMFWKEKNYLKNWSPVLIFIVLLINFLICFWLGGLSWFKSPMSRVIKEPWNWSREFWGHWC